MMINSRFVLFIVLFFVNSVLTGQTKTIHGYVRDGETGEALPMANIQVEGTYRGTISNQDGKYILELKEVPASIFVRYIGYESKRITVTESSPSEISFSLVPKVIEFEPIVVTEDDPAVHIMKKVIEKKKQWRSSLETYRAEAYTRIRLEKDTGIVSISESMSQLFWDREEGFREVVKSKRSTSNVRPDQNFAFAIFLPNLYNDDIEILGFRMIGPTHPKALDFYHFTLEGERYLDDRVIYDISVKPKSTLEPAFVGRMAVLDETYAMIEADLKPNEAVFFPQPIQDMSLYFKQQFSNFGQAYWFPVDVQVGGTLKVGMVGLDFPLIKYQQVSRLTEYEVNVELPDSLYQGKKVVYQDTLSIRQDTLFAVRPYMVPLTTEESEAYASLDSTMTLQNAFKPEGFLTRFAKINVEVRTEKRGSSQASSSKGASRGLSFGLGPQLGFNRVDALHLGATCTAGMSEGLQFRLQGAYKTGLKRWGYGSDLTFKWGKERNGFFKIGYAEGADTRTHSGTYPALLNSIHTLLGFEDYFDYYWNRQFQAALGYRVSKISTQWSLEYRDSWCSSVEKSTDWNLLEKNRTQRMNPAVDDGRLRSVKASVVIGEKSIPWGTGGLNRMILDVEHSSPDFLSSDFSFTQCRMVFDGQLPTFFRRRLLPNALDFRFVAGVSTGRVPVQRLGSMDVRMGALSPFGVFRTLRRQQEGEKYVGFFWEHNFRTLPFELLGLRGLAKKGYGILLHGASGRTWISDRRRETLTHEFLYLEDFHHEIGLSLNGVLGLFRIDFTKRLGSPDVFVGFSLARIF